MSFRDVAGHRRLKRLLARALHSGTLPPSLLFAGPEGVGKRQVAYAVAQALNCLEPVVDEALGERDGCGVCAVCTRIARRQHPDVTQVDRLEDKSDINVEQIREVVGQTAYRPFEGRVRVVIIDNADLVGDFGQNALLKTLEEPPARNVFVLVTSRPSVLLTTVRSRCCMLRFAPVPPADVAAALVGRHGFGEAEAQSAAALSGGSFARALEAGRDGRSDARRVAVDLLARTARADARSRLKAGADLLKSAGRKSGEMPKDGKGSGADRASVAERLRAMGSLLRDLSVLTTRAPEAALVNLDLRDELEPLARQYDRDRLVRAFSAVGRSLWALERNASPKIVADWLVLQL
jgi:DNA polymerase-3 subunit delta'